jgi:hypothetical protein
LRDEVVEVHIALTDNRPRQKGHTSEEEESFHIRAFEGTIAALAQREK